MSDPAPRPFLTLDEIIEQIERGEKMPDEVGCPICLTYWIKIVSPIFLGPSLAMIYHHMRHDHPVEWAKGPPG